MTLSAMSRFANKGWSLSKGDLALAAGLLCVALLSGVFVDTDRPGTVAPNQGWHWLLIATPPVLVAFRRVKPMLATVIATLAQIVIWTSDLPEVLLPMIVILYSAAAEGGMRGISVAIGASAALTMTTAIGIQIAADVTVYQLPLIMLTCGTAIALGINSARQRDFAALLATEVTETRLRSEYQQTQAVLAERSHIARELHDVIGHTLSVIAVRAEAADRVADTRPEAAGDAVSAIAEAARSALSETRRVLAGLRESAEVELAPPPDLESIRHLVSELGNAGIKVTMNDHGCDVFKPSAVVIGGAYRIVRESLTNAVKHAGPAVSVDVTVHCTAAQLEITIENDKPDQSRVGYIKAAPAGDSGIVGSVGAGDSVTGGSGLAAMQERAQVLGGSFSARQNQQGGFVVRALLPNARGITEKT